MKRLILASLCVLLFAAGSAWADLIDLPVKWSQVPWDPDGADYLSDCLGGTGQGQVIADDFLCLIPEPIVAVRWWGSYKHEKEPRDDGWTGPFDISFHNSLGPHPGSLPVPGPPITMYTVNAQEVFVGFDNSGEPVYRYDAYLTDAAGAQEPFDQWRYSQDQRYNIGELFIDICKPTLQNWGWHEVAATHPILDYAVAAPTHGGPWGRAGCGTDMAFELMVLPEPTTIGLLGLGSLVLLRKRR